MSRRDIDDAPHHCAGNFSLPDRMEDLSREIAWVDLAFGTPGLSHTFDLRTDFELRSTQASLGLRRATAKNGLQSCEVTAARQRRKNYANHRTAETCGRRLHFVPGAGRRKLAAAQGGGGQAKTPRTERSL
jgi:hypothetical protein